MRKRMKDSELKAFVSKLNWKREILLTALLKLEERRRDAQRQLERRMRLRAKEAAGSPGKSEPAPENDVAARKVPTQSDAIAVKDDGIPDYLRRDQLAREKVESEVAAARKAKVDRATKKRAIKHDMIKADLTGQTRRMPLEGKAALAAISKR